MRTITSRAPKPPALTASATCWRAATLASGATESSRSRMTRVAGQRLRFFERARIRSRHVEHAAARTDGHVGILLGCLVVTPAGGDARAPMHRAGRDGAPAAPPKPDMVSSPGSTRRAPARLIPGSAPMRRRDFMTLIGGAVLGGAGIGGFPLAPAPSLRPERSMAFSARGWRTGQLSASSPWRPTARGLSIRARSAWRTPPPAARSRSTRCSASPR